MAIFHMSFQNISAGKMRSSVASASYRSGESLYREADEKNYKYTRIVKPESGAGCTSLKGAENQCDTGGIHCRI